MGKAEFNHLHVHSNYSLLDGVADTGDLVRLAASHGMDAMAITEHGNLFSAYEFYQAAEKEGIKPILGMEAYAARKSAKEPKDGSAGNPTDHLLLLAENEAGWKNLMHLSTRGYTEGHSGTPRIDMEMLSEHSKGIIATTSCLAGGFSRGCCGEKHYNRSTKEYVHTAPDLTEGMKYVSRLTEILGKDNVFIEIQDHTDSKAAMAMDECRTTDYQELVDLQSRTWKAAIDAAKKLDVGLIGSNDVHFLKEEHGGAKDTLFAIRTRQQKHDPARSLYSTSNQFYLKSPEEMVHIFREVPEAVENTLRIAERCNVKLDLGGHWHFPEFEVPGSTDLMTFWRHSIRMGFEKLYPQGNPLREMAIQRIKHEIKIIERLNFVSYIMITADFVNFARRSRIPYGPGRGSAAGSIVSYCLGITEICPLENKLIFERFLNPDRVSFPDIDLDFCYNRIGEIYQYAQTKYGKECVARISTFGTMWTKSIVRETAKTYGVNLFEIDEVAKTIGDAQGSFRSSVEAELEENEALGDFYQNDHRWKQALDDAKILEGSKRSVGKHAAGIVIGDRDLSNYIPLMKPAKPGNKDRDEAVLDETNDMLATQAPMDDLEALGLIKMDFLALETLTVLQRAVEMAEKRTGKKVEVDNSLKDPKVYELLSSGNCIGIFQTESPGLRNLLIQMNPDRFDNVVDAISLYRPGPLDMVDPETSMTMVQTYVRNKRKRMANPEFRWDVAHPKLEPILDETYGVVVYQEQIMRITQDLAGYTMAQADTFRKVVGKKKLDEMEKLRPEFIAACNEHSGIDASTALYIFEQLAAFARYGFNKAHAAAYSVVTYRTAWMKTYYPTEYLASLFTSAAGKPNFIEVKKLVEDCNVNNIPVVAPNVNTSPATSSSLDGSSIVAGLDLIKGLGVMAEKIVADRPEGGFSSAQEAIEHLVAAGCSSGHMKGLISAGALDDFGGRNQLFANYKHLLPQIRQYNSIEHHQYSLIDHKFALSIEPINEDDDNTIECLGVYVKEINEIS